jgi:hypothetical protein
MMEMITPQSGMKIIYKPVTMRRGMPQKPKAATILKYESATAQVRIRCDGESIQRVVKIKHIEILS